MTVIPSALDIQDEAMRQVLSDIHTCMPGEVVAVRDDPRDKRQFVDVQPMLRRAVIDADGEQIDEALPLVQMVPVGYLQGGGFFLSVPLQPGDPVLIVFAERSLDNWIQNAAGARKPGTPPVKPTPVIPGDLATHSLQGAIVLPLGPAPRSRLLAGVDAIDMVVGLANGTILARFKPDGSVVFAEGAGTDFVALAAKVDFIIATLDGVIRNWVPVPQDGGAALQVAYKAAFGSPPSSVAASKTKAT